MKDAVTGKAKGGVARAKALSPEERSQIARRAALERWNNDLPVAEHSGILSIVDTEVQCYVIADGTRVISTRAIMKSLRRTWRGRKYTGTELPVFVEAHNLKPFITDELSKELVPIVFRTATGVKGEGYRAEALPHVCEIYLAAREAGVLNKAQLTVAQRCEAIVRALSRVGIIALVDEATGYQSVREKDALQKILERYLTDYARRWAKTFPDEFWDKLLRAKGYESYIGLPRPNFIGHWVNDVVYSRLAPGIHQKLKELNPRMPSGRRKYKNFQFLTEDHGVPELKEHLVKAMTVMDIAIATGQNFDLLLGSVLPKYGETMTLPIVLTERDVEET
jgi:hypothetical protein